MKIRVNPAIICTYILTAAILFLAAVLLSSCSTNERHREDRTSANLSEVEEDISQAVRQVDITNASLQYLIMSGQTGDARRAFENYSDNVDKMDRQGKRLLEHVDKMHDQGKVRVSEVSSVEIKDSFEAYMSGIREIQNYLSNDLTPKGVESITAAANQAITDGERFKNSVAPVLIALNHAN